jgi:DNA-binding MarR family transcriptional regulator
VRAAIAPRDTTRIRCTEKAVRDAERCRAAGPPYPGLTEAETRVLQALIGLGEGSVEAVAEATHLMRPEVVAALDRLVALSFALRAVMGEQTVYRPVEHTL